MDIKNLLQKLQNSQTEDDKQSVLAEIKTQFNVLNDSEKEEIRKIFNVSLDEQLAYTKEKLNEIDIKLEMLEVSQYISLAKIAKDYFGKSKYWLYQRIYGYNVNGKPARFTENERHQLSFALQDIGHKLNETSFKFV